MSTDHFQALTRRAIPHMRAILEHLGRTVDDEGNNFIILSCFRDDKHRGSFRINRHSGRWTDFADKIKVAGVERQRGGDFIDLLRGLLGEGTTPTEAATWLEQYLLSRTGPGADGTAIRVDYPVEPDVRAPCDLTPTPADAPDPPFSLMGGTDWMRHTYRDCAGRPMMHVERCATTDGRKIFRPWTWRAGAWRSKGLDRPLIYGLDLLATHPGKPVLWVEGEKTADAARGLLPEYVVIANSSAGEEKVDWIPLADRAVAIWPDADDAGTRRARKAVEAMKAVGVSAAIVELPDRLPPGWDLADPLPEGLTIEGVRERIVAAIGVKRDAEVPGHIRELNQEWAVVGIGGKARIMRETPGGNVLDHLYDPTSFRILLKPRRTDDGKSLAEDWLNSPLRRTYEGIAFDPGGVPDGIYNLWRGWAVEPRPGECDLFYELVRDIICEGNARDADYLLDWVAHLCQRPGHKPGVAVVLIGDKGTGKSTFGQVIGRLLGRHYYQTASKDNLFGKHNAEMADKLLAHGEEIYWGGDRDLEGRLKHLITGPTIVVEPKNINSFTVASYHRLLITSNADWVVPATADERRYFVRRVGNRRRRDLAFFGALMAQMEAGGYAALLHDMLTRDISTFDPMAVPRTQALAEQIEASLPREDRWLHDELSTGEIWQPLHGCRDGLIRKSTLRTRYQNYMRRTGGKHPMSDAGFTKFLQRRLPSVGLERPREDGKQVPSFRLPSLAVARAEFVAATGIAPVWPDDPAPAESGESSLRRVA